MGLDSASTRRPSLQEVEAFEARHGIRLPADYREFLLEIGNGGCGPYYGVFKLGEMDHVHGVAPLNPDVIGDMSRPFPHTGEWNDLTGEPGSDLAGDEYDQAEEAFYKRYWNPSNTNGSFPICHIGCALRILLVVTGPEAGNLWRDELADHEGVSPVAGPGPGLPRVSFVQWYRAWIEDELGERQHTWL